MHVRYFTTTAVSAQYLVIDKSITCENCITKHSHRESLSLSLSWLVSSSLDALSASDFWRTFIRAVDSGGLQSVYQPPFKSRASAPGLKNCPKQR